MGSEHFLFIPGVLAVGVVLGFLLGARAARDAYQRELEREKERELARAARAERKRKRGATDDAAS